MRKNLIYLFLILTFSCQRHSDKNLRSIPEQKEDPFATFEQLVLEYEDPERSDWQNPDLVIKLLNSLEGDTVADIGAGTGYFTFRLSRSADRVIATDIEEKFVQYIEEKKREFPAAIASKIQTRLVRAGETGLKDNEVDKILIVNTYHYFTDRKEYLKKLYKGLKKGGVVLIVDYKKMDLPVGPPQDFLVGSSQVVEEMKTAGFDIVLLDSTSLDYQYILKATKN